MTFVATFVNKSDTFALLNKKEFMKQIKTYGEQGHIFNKYYKADFRIRVDNLDPEFIYHKNNADILYSYDYYLKAIKAFKIFECMGTVGFYYCREIDLPLFVVDNVNNVTTAFAIAPRV